MGLIRTVNPLTGDIISHEIEGDSPTQEETLEIQQYMSLLGKQKAAENIPDDDGNLFTKGISIGVDQLQRAYGDALVGVGKGLGIDTLRDYGQEVADRNAREIEEQSADVRRLDSINDLSTFGDYAASTFGQQLPNLLPSVVGGIIGSFAGPAGTIGGIKIGTMIGASLANLPYFYGTFVPSATDPETGEVNQLKALAYAAPSAALDTLGDLLVTAGFAGKLLSGGGLFTRAGKGAGKGVAAEVPTEIGQEILQRHAEGKPLWNQEALDTYLEVAAAAGLVGGTVSSVGNIVGGQKKNEPDEITQLETDITKQAKQVDIMNANATNFMNREKDINDFKDSTGKFITLSQLPDHIKQEVIDRRTQDITFGDVVSGAVNPDLEINKETLSQQDLDIVVDRVNDLEADVADKDYNKVKDAVKAKGEYNQGIARQALKTKDKPNIPQSKINGIRDKLLKNGVIKKEKNKLIPTTTTQQDINLKAEQLKSRVKSILKEMSKVQAKKKEQMTIEDPSIEQINEIDEMDAQIDALSEEYKKVSNKASTLARESERKLGTPIRLAQIIPSLEAKNAFNNANVKTPEYSAKQLNVQKALRSMLTALGLGGVKLDFKPIITPKGVTPEDMVASGTVVEGVHSNKVIALAMEIYDPNLTEAELQQKLASVMNHEIIHALFEMGVFSKQDQQTLINVADKKKYVEIIDGKPVTRKYTYMKRAAYMYQTKDNGKPYTKAEQAEEAVAELYRDWADKKITLVAKPKNLFDRILKFFKAIFTSHSQEGFRKANDLFTDIGSTDFQKRVSRAQKQKQDPDALQEVLERESRLGRPVILTDEVMRNAQYKTAKKTNSPDQKKIQSKLFKNRELPEGQMVTVRPNLNGFVELEDGSMGMTQTVHPARTYGTALGYDSVVAITNSELLVSPQKRADIYKGVTRTGAKQDKVPMAGGYGAVSKISIQQITDIIDNSDDVLSFNPGRESAGINGVHLFVNKDGYAVKSIEGTAVHFGGKVFVKGKVNFWTEQDAPKPLDNIPTDVKYIPSEPKYSLIGKRQQEKFSKLRNEIRVNLSAATGTITGLKNLQDAANAGDEDAMTALQEVAINSVNYLTEAIPSVEVTPTPAYGLYGSALEPAVGLNIEFDTDKKDLALSALAQFASNFNQEQIHVRENAQNRLVGYKYGDGSFNTPIVTFKLSESIPKKELSSIIDKSGLAAFTVTDKSLQSYYLGDPNDRTEIRKFRAATRRAGQLLGTRVSAISTGLERLWAYGRGYGATNTYEQIEGFFPLPKTDQADRTANRIATRLAQRIVDPTIQAKTLTEQQKLLQMDIAKEYDAMSLNNLDNDIVRRAYSELAQEVTEQYNAMPIKVEIYKGQGEPYTGAKMSEAMRKDILQNNHLYIFGTDVNKFGPKGVVYDNHPLLETTGIVDINGRPMLVNDLLRAVHDYYAHTMSTVGFGPLGEEAAWRNHMIMTKSPYARWALTSETRGQNSWVNFNEQALNVEKLSDRPFAEQKVDLLPVKYLITNDQEVDATLSELQDLNLQEDDEKFSIKGIKPKSITIVNRLDDNGNFIQSAKPESVKMTNAIKKLHQEKGGVVLDIEDAQDREIAERAILIELKEFVNADESAIGWYDDKIKTAKKLYAIKIPEIANDKNAESAFDFALAITSNGEAVKSQSASIKRQMENWKTTGRFLEDNQGNQATGMTKSFKVYNLLKDKGLTDQDIKQFLQIKKSKKEIETLPEIQELNQFLNKDIKITGELIDEMVPMSFIFGSKIGSFYQNIIGNYEYLTMDRWFMRSMNRIFGTPFKIIKPDTLTKNRREALDGINDALENGTEDEKTRIKVATDELGIDIINESNIVDLSIVINNKLQKDIERAGRAGPTKPFIEKTKTDMLKATQRLAENSVDTLQESPKNGTQRKVFRNMFARIVTKFNRTSNRQITIADAQAVYWYGEKRLFKSLGVRTGQGSDNDYVDAAIDFLRKEGVNEETIGEALPSAEREQRLGDRDTRQQALLSTGQVAENNGYAKRKFTEEEIADRDVLESFDNDEINNLKEDIDNVKYAFLKRPSVNKKKRNFAEEHENSKSDFSDYVFGFIRRKNANNQEVTVPILYPTGEHSEIGPYRYKGFGKKHIDAVRPLRVKNRFKKLVEIGEKSHAQEIMDIFGEGFDSADEVIEDALHKFELQQSRNVDYGIYPDPAERSGETLFFDKLKSSGDRQYRLVISLKEVKPGQPVDKTVATDDDPSAPVTFKSRVFVVQTAYPKEKTYSYSTLGSATMNLQETPTSQAILEGVGNARLKIRYDNLSKVLARFGHKFTIGRADEEKLRKAAQDLLIQTQDRFLPIGALMDKFREAGVNITDAMDVYLQEELYHGVAGAKVDKAQKELFEPMMKQVDSLNVSEESLNDLKSLSKFYRIASGGRYISNKLALADAILYASHAEERNIELNNPKASGMHTNEANRILRWINTLPQTEKDKINLIINSAKAIVKNTNEERIQGGLIPEVFVNDRGEQYTNIYENYVPLRGDLGFEEEINADNNFEEREENFIIQNLFGALGKPDRKAKGRIRSDEGGDSDYYAENIIASLFAQNNKSIADAERNKVGLSYLNLIRGIEEGEVVVDNDLKKEMQHLSGVYFKKDDIPKQQRGDGSPDKVKEPFLTVRENGREVYITFNDPRIARAMKGMMTPESVGRFTRALGKLNRYLSNINTTYNPSFVIPNFARDLATAGVNVQQYDEKGLTSEVLKGTFGAVNGIRKNLRDGDTNNFWAKEYLKFVDAGGKNATNQMNDLQDQMNRIKGILSDVSDNSKKGKLGLVKNAFKGLGKFLDDYNTAVENGVRVSTYTALVKRGVTPARAAQAARNITVNFAKGGEQKQFLNSWYLFYNASFQGSMALINAAVKSKRVRKVWAGLVVYGIVQDQFNAFLSGDEDDDGVLDYDKLNRHVLEHNFILPTFGLADDKYISIPLAYGLNVAVNLGRSMSRAARGEYTAGQAARSIFGTTFESLSPFGGFDNFYNLAAPTVLDPFVSVAINEDYKGDPIFKETPQFASRPVPNSQAYWSSTSRIPKSIVDFINTATGGDAVESGLIDMSPDVLEFWFDYATGGVGRFVQRSVEAPFNIIDAINGDFQAPIATAIPFARKVIISPSERQDVSDYLENRKALFTIMARYDLARRTGDIEAINNVLEDNKEQLRIVPRLKAIDNARNRLLRQIRELERNVRLDETTRKNLIRIRRERINDLMRRGLILMRSVGFREAS